MKSSEIRQRFVKYFESKGHKYNDSSSIIPENDPTLLFANAGMNQFKDIFTGKSNPEEKRAVTIQKCVRAGGKHNDLDNVGFTARHHTFFEMLGNFSFGDYFKKDAIAFAWEFLTKELGIDKDKLYVTCHHTDTEAADIWHNQEGVPRERIFFRGDKDNFWEMGDVGPCGPCSEIFYDHGKEHTDPNADTSQCLLDDEGRYIEIWNLVFMQYEKYTENGEIKKRELPKPSIDTGAGLERVTAVMQGKYNNFDTDGLQTIIKGIEELTGKKYVEHLAPMRVVADHIRAVTMMLTDGVIPSNEGRGYVLRRIIRRATRFLNNLNVDKTSLYKLVEVVSKSFEGQYPDIEKNQSFVMKYLKIEEESFRKTLNSGLKLLEKEIERLKSQGKNELEGEVVFTLYDTHGFPDDLTEVILKETGLTLDKVGFEKHMEEQKQRSKQAGDFSVKEDNLKTYYRIKEDCGDTKFLGYDHMIVKAKLVAVEDTEKYTALVFDKTPFYPEGGGQAGDKGLIRIDENIICTVFDTKKPVDGLIVHYAQKTHNLEIGKEYNLEVDSYNRNLTARNHTATHLLQAALISVLGDHVKQSGSSVSAERLRFDFTHPEGLNSEEVARVERIVNEQIRNATTVSPEVMSKDQAMQKGATALFGEKYGDEVRVVEVPGFSIELCGGTHVQNTNQISVFKIVSEGSLSTGIRRIEAVTSEGAIKYYEDKLDILHRVETILKSKGEQLVTKSQGLIDELSNKNKELKTLQDKVQASMSDDLFKDTEKLGKTFVYKYAQVPEGSDIKKLADLFMDKHPKGVVLLATQRGDQAGVILRTAKNNKDINCSDTLRDCVAEFGGRGGGKPDMAQGSVPIDKLESFSKTVLKKLKSLV